MLLRALESDWAVVSEQIGLWIPIEVGNEEHNDKPEGESEIGNSLVKNFPPSFVIFQSPSNAYTVIIHDLKWFN